MHDLDQTQLDYSRAEFDDDEFELEGEFENDMAVSGADEYEDEDEFESEYEFESNFDGNSPFSEAEEMELAAELMEIADDGELEYFLGRLIKRGARRVGRRLRKRVGTRLRKGLKRLAKRGLRFAGGAVGGALGGPVGAVVGRAAGRGLGKVFGLELEGMSLEDQEFEAARQFVRLAGDATSTATAIPSSVNEEVVAHKALKRSVVKFAPGLAGKTRRSVRGEKSGRWVRKGSSIILMGV